MAERAITKDRHERRGPLVRGPKASLTFVSALIALGVLMLTAAPAFAVTGGWLPSGSFGSFGTGSGQLQSNYFSTGGGVAVDESTGDVYVTDNGNARVEKFDASGNFLAVWGYGVIDGSNTGQVCTASSGCHAGLPGIAPGQFSDPSGIAVDNSNGPNAGDVYVVDGNNPNGPGANNRISKFRPDGTYLGQLDASTSLDGAFAALPFSDAVAVDRSGYVWVADNNQRVLKFSNQPTNVYVTGSQANTSQAGGIAVNGAGTKLYLISSCCGEAFHSFNTDGTNQGRSFAGGGYNDELAVDQATGHVFASTGNSQFDEYQPDGTLIPETTFGAGMFGYSDGIAVNSVTKTIYVVDMGGSKVYKFVPRIVPEVITGDTSAVGHTNATLTGHVAPDSTGGGDVSDCHFEYGTTTSYGSTVLCTPTTPYSGAINVTADISGLTSDMTYHYRLVASNSIGANRGADKTVEPNAVFDTVTSLPTKVTPTGATLNGTFTGDGAQDTNYHFEWGTDTTYGNSTPTTHVGVTTGPTPASAEIGGLVNYTFYHYRLVTTDSLGTSYSPDRTFYSAPPIAPLVVDTGVSEVGSDNATVGAQINPGEGDTNYLVEYGTSTSYGHHTLAGSSIGTDNTFHPVSTLLAGLARGTTYHFRFVAMNFTGATHGPDHTLTTSDVPSVDVSYTSAVGQTTATLAAVINPNSAATTYHFEYGTDAGYGSRTSERAAGSGGTAAQTVSADLGGLAPGKTYHFRVVATNSVGTITGLDQTFTTSPAPAGNSFNSTATGCKTGFVKKAGKCVKKKAHHKKRKHDRAGGRNHG